MIEQGVAVLIKQVKSEIALSVGGKVMGQDAVDMGIGRTRFVPALKYVYTSHLTYETYLFTFVISLRIRRVHFEL